MNYTCKHCNFTTASITTFVRHLSIHRNLSNFRFPCGVAKCFATFVTRGAVQSHMYRFHKKTARPGLERKIDGVDLACTVEGCNYVSANFPSIREHLHWHIKDGTEVSCPYINCLKHFRVRSTFASHLSRKHKSVSSSPRISQSSTTSASTNITCASMSSDSELDHTFETAFDDDHDNTNDKVDTDDFMNNLAMFYLRMQAKMLLPASTIQTLIEEITEVHNTGLSHLLSRMHEELTKLNVPENDIKSIIDNLSKDNLLKICNDGVFRTDQTRKTFFKSRFSYVEPVKTYLGIDAKGKERFYQYVPIKDTIKSLLSQNSVKEQYDQAKADTETNPDVLEDVRDGRNFKESILLRDLPSSLSLILYQDSFEVANPLGSGRKKHKILAMYMTLAEIAPHNRSSIDPMQLVMLCREEDFQFFGQEKVFSTLVSDLKEMEENGIEYGAEEKIKASVIAITGDNLGSHSIGGFTENFSKSTHFCRYCVIDRVSFQTDPCKSGPKRTIESYKNSVAAQADQEINDGIKFDSIFNQLKYFHVCQPGLPPCLGHDLFEGVVSFDLAMYIKHLVTVGKHFTYGQLNRTISQFTYQGSDANNKPCEVKPNSEKLGGHAAQNWCLLRLFPILVGDRIKNPLDDEVWQLCLKLREIVDLICAPKIHTNQVAHLKILIEEYIQLRTATFPEKTLKPKHHYLVHYPELILQFGPLIRLWTLRFESKHSYFKQCARKLHNFKNLCSTLAERHQLLQAYLHAGNLFPPTLQMGQPSTFDDKLYQIGIQRAVSLKGLRPEHTIETPSVTFKGTLYKRGMTVVVDQNDTGYLLGKILLILVNEATVHFVVQQYQSVPVVDLGVYCLQSNSEAHYQCLTVEKLVDYYPLSVYNQFGLNLVALHHSVFQKNE